MGDPTSVKHEDKEPEQIGDPTSVKHEDKEPEYLALLESSNTAATPSFVEHILAATVSEVMEGKRIEQFIKALKTATSLPGVFATHVGRCNPVLGSQTFLMHIRAADLASCDAAYLAAHEAYMAHLAQNKMDTARDFGDIVIVDWDARPYGSSNWKWPALRVAIFKFKQGTPRERVTKLENEMIYLPSKFPLVKQITWGYNKAKQRSYRPNYGYADVDHDVGVVLGFNSRQDMETLGDDPAYWEVLNMHGISMLDNYQVLTFPG